MLGRLLIAASVAAIQPEPPPSPIRADEQVVIFPGLAHRGDAGGWVASVRAWVFEPEEDSPWRRAVLDHFGASLGDEADRQRLAANLRPFIVDNERGKELTLEVAGAFVVTPATGANGQAAASFPLGGALAEHQAGVTPVSVILPPDDPRQFVGRLHLVAPEGRSIVCDVDDTIRASGVHDRELLLRNTFVLEWEPAPGMPDFLRALAEAPHEPPEPPEAHGPPGAPAGEEAFVHYVSAMPWQLHPLLEEFLSRSDLPLGSCHLRNVRLKDETLWTLLDSPFDHKLGVIEDLMRRWPGRTFTLVGDSGESDPEVYGEIARTFPAQVERIWIRSVRGEDASDPRYAAAFAGVERARWTVFTEAPSPEEVMRERTETLPRDAGGR